MIGKEKRIKKKSKAYYLKFNNLVGYEFEFSLVQTKPVIYKNKFVPNLRYKL